MKLLRIFNRQKKQKLNGPLLRRIGLELLRELLSLSQYELGVHLVGATEMAELNETFLGHAGSTDVITFSHGETAGPPSQPLAGTERRAGRGRASPGIHGEIFISVDDAVAQAGPFRTTWQAEIVRYLAHGVLHLQGYDDKSAGPRRVMKREENKLVKELSRRFDLGRLNQAKNASRRK